MPEEIRQSDHFTEEEPVMFNLKALLTGDMNRLRYIHRFSTAFVLHKENVAEHSFYVTLYSYLMALWCLQRQLPVNIVEVFEKAILHDAEESITGDVNRPFKYSDGELKEVLDRHAAKAYQKLISDVLPDTGLQEHCLHLWKTARDESLEGRIVAFADFLSVLSHLWAEVDCSNASMLHHYETMISYADEFRHPSYEFLRPLTDEAIALIHEVLGDRRNELVQQ